MQIREMQNLIGAWSRKNFGSQYSSSRKHTMGSLAPLLGCQEELGELCHAVLKNAQGIRGMENEEKYMEARNDACADFFIYLLDFAERENFDLQEVIEKTVEKILKRDWNKDRVSGGEPC